MKINLYALIDDAVERGVAMGHERAYRHADAPSREYVNSSISHEVMNAICEFVDFGDFYAADTTK